MSAPPGRNVVVTGAASGIGRQVALEAVERGAATVWLVDRNDAGLRSLEAELGPRAELRIRVLDVTSRAAVADLAGEWAAGDCPDVLLNVAGIRASTATLLEVTDAEWDDALATNLTGTFLMMRAAAREMVRRRVAGVIINVASTAAVIGFARRTAYCASKAGVVGLTKAAALDLAPHGIRVVAVSPGFIRSGISDDIDESAVVTSVPLGRRGDPRELARLMFDLAAASFLTGSNVLVDGGALAGTKV